MSSNSPTTSSNSSRRRSRSASAFASSTTAWSSTESPSTAIVRAAQGRLAALAGLRVAALALLFLACAPLHLIEKALTGRSGWPRRFLGVVGWIIGIRVRVEGAPVTGHTLLLANHLSWIDILVLAGTTGAAFVSKDNLGNGFIHWLADQNHTV